MLNINKKAFTLVELIVVITILAILGTIGFISLQGYSSASRDSKRITDLGQVRIGVQLYQAKEGVVPEPSETKTIIGSGITNLIIQGYAGIGVLNNIRVNDDAKDPLEDNYYTYSTNGAKTKFQLLALLENQETAYNNVIPTTYANYENRNTYVIGDKLGIILDSTTNTPVQELGETNIDLSNNTTEYKTVFSKSDIQTLSGSSLHQEIVTKSNNTGVEEEPISTEPIVYSSCKEILDNGASTGNGIYTIDPENNGVGFDVYCDMISNGGGWTLVYKNNGGPSFLNNNSHDNIMSETASGLVVPYNVSGNFGYAKSKAFEVMKEYTNKELLKQMIGYNGNGEEIGISSLESSSSYYPIITTPINAYMKLGQNKVNDILFESSSLDSNSCNILSDQVELYINGDFQGKSNKVLKWGSASLGFANPVSTTDLCGEDINTSNNIMKDWHSRHILGYSTTNVGRDSVRCQPRCWSSSDENQLIEVLWFIR